MFKAGENEGFDPLRYLAGSAALRSGIWSATISFNVSLFRRLSTNSTGAILSYSTSSAVRLLERVEATG